MTSRLIPSGDSGDVRRLVLAAERVLHVGVRLRAGGAQPVAEVAVRVLVEPDDVRRAAVDRDLARPARSVAHAGADHPNRSCGRTSSKRDGGAEAQHLVDLVLDRPLRVVGRGGGTREREHLGGLIVTIPSYVPPAPTLPSANITGGELRPRALPLALDGSTFVESAPAGSVAFAVVSFGVVASAASAPRSPRDHVEAVLAGGEEPARAGCRRRVVA